MPVTVTSGPLSRYGTTWLIAVYAPMASGRPCVALSCAQFWPVRMASIV